MKLSMQLNKLFLSFICFFIFIQFAKATEINAVSINMGNVKFSFALNEKGIPEYSVFYKGKVFIKPSAMGFRLADDSVFYKNFELRSVDSSMLNYSWKPVWGEVNTITDHHKEVVFHLRQKNSPFRMLNIIFRVFEDGIGFRYEFPKQPDLKYFIVTDELTYFNLTADHKAFWIPGDYDTNEYLYSTTRLSAINNKKMVQESTDICVRVAPDQASVQTPLMLKSDDGLYINIHEAALTDYSAMQLHVGVNDFSLLSELVPDAYGNKAYLHAPAVTPWRTIIVSDKATDILASKMILNLNDPAKTENTSWIHPMKFVGIWWEMQTDHSTWRYAEEPAEVNGKLIPNHRHGANTANVKRYIDFAAVNNIKGVLVEGWNTGWEDWFGNWKEKTFNFVKPYPDFDVPELQQYAALKSVNIIMHHETSGSVTDYERQMDTAYRFMNQFGYTSVKTGYVGKIVPRGEHHDGQWMVDHYIRVAQKTLDNKIMVDMHEAVRPTGLQRTYPNWLASEAGRGNEYNAFSNGSPPEHETILPFTRLMGGPMDYTPGIFKLKRYSAVKADRQMHTTLAKQLALYITIYSPLQMVADLPENYTAHMDAFQFVKDVGVDWDDTKILEAEPGDYVTIARKEKGTDNWFIGAITDEHSRKAIIPLTFLDKGKKYMASVYEDAADADWQSNPEAYKIEHVIVDSKIQLQVLLAKGGGAAISIKIADADALKKYKNYKPL